MIDVKCEAMLKPEAEWLIKCKWMIKWVKTKANKKENSSETNTSTNLYFLIICTFMNAVITVSWVNFKFHFLSKHILQFATTKWNQFGNICDQRNGKSVLSHNLSCKRVIAFMNTHFIYHFCLHALLHNVGCDCVAIQSNSFSPFFV